MGPDPDTNKMTPGGIALAVVVLLLGFFLVLKPLLKSNGSSGGQLGGGGCSTSLKYNVPKSQLQGVGSTMTAQRCSGSYDQNGHLRSYVEATVVVNARHVRWQIRHVPARVVIVVKLKTDGNKLARPAKHVFSIP
jgi:hypothetical protein